MNKFLAKIYVLIAPFKKLLTFELIIFKEIKN